jgi:hypothetical protein
MFGKFHKKTPENKSGVKTLFLYYFISKKAVFQLLFACKIYDFFYYPDFTVGFGISPNHAQVLVGFNHRYGIAPIPEDIKLN